MTASGTVLILTPLKDATAHVDGYLANLRRLTYPNKRISLGLLESDSADETYLAFEQRVPDLRTKFRSVGLWKRDFGYRLPTHVHRWAPTVQVMRRAVLARSRNHLLFRALDDQDWVRPEEISLFRSVYGKQFILVSAFAPLYVRRKRIEELERRSRGGLISDVEVQTLAHALVTQDAEESLEKSGQKLRDAFPLGDVFIDATTKPTCEAMIRRFIQLFFGNNRISPTRDEYGMYLAKSASLRSLDLSRQVGAAAFNKHGEVVSLGCNEVPRAGGGTYWSGEGLDHRDVIEGHDPNETKKIEVLADIIDRLKRSGHLSIALSDMADPYLITKHLLAENSDCNVADSKIMDLIEFGRIIHAEMSAICDASRNGLSLNAATIYCTTFPCHICAKHIIASGVSRVVYLEPYPKSYAFELHDDSIVVDAGEQTEKFASIHSSGLLRIGIEIFLRKDGESMPVGLPRNGTRVSADL